MWRCIGGPFRIDGTSDIEVPGTADSYQGCGPKYIVATVGLFRYRKRLKHGASPLYLVLNPRREYGEDGSFNFWSLGRPKVEIQKLAAELQDTAGKHREAVVARHTGRLGYQKATQLSRNSCRGSSWGERWLDSSCPRLWAWLRCQSLRTSRPWHFCRRW